MKDQLQMFSPETLSGTPNATSSPAGDSGASLSDKPDGPMTGPSGPEAAPAQVSQQQEKARGLQTLVTSGRIGCGSSASAALQSSLANRLVQRLDMAGSTLFRMTWKRKLTPLGRPYLERAASALRTSGSGFGSWPTPQALGDTTRGGAGYEGNSENAPERSSAVIEPERLRDVGILGNSALGGLGIAGSAPGSAGHADLADESLRMGIAIGAGLEGLGGYGGDGSEPGRLGAEQVGPATEAGESGGMADAASIERPGPVNGLWRNADWIRCRDGKWRPVEPGSFPLAHGSTARVGRLRMYGDGIVVPVAQAFIEAVKEVVGKAPWWG